MSYDVTKVDVQTRIQLCMWQQCNCRVCNSACFTVLK